MSRDIKAGGAYVELLMKDANFVAGLKRASAKLKSFGAAAQRIGSLGFLGGGGIGRLFAGAGAAAALAWPVKLAANLEVAKAEFEALIGDADKAGKLFAQMQQFALVSPLGTQDLADAGRKLLVAGMSVDEIMPKLKQLGEIAGGNGEKMNLLALAFAQCISKGRLMGQEANQMAESGFSPLAEISRTTGETIGDLMKKMEAGEISVAMVSKALETATGAGGRFNGLLAKIAGTAKGQFDQFTESITAAVTPLGEALLPSLKSLLEIVNGGMPGVAKILKENAASFVTVATAAVGVAAGASALISFGVAAKVAGVALSGIAGTLGLLLNPITLITAGIAGAVYAFATLTETGRAMVSSLANWFGQLKDIATQTFAGIGDALAAGDLSAAANIAWLGLKAAWLQGTKGLREIWESFKQVFMQTTIDIVYDALGHWEKLVSGIQTMLTKLKASATDAMMNVGAWLHKIGKSEQEKAAIDRVNEMAKAGFRGKTDAELAAIEAARKAKLDEIEANRKIAQDSQRDAFFGEMDRINKDLAAAKAELAEARANAAKARAEGVGMNGGGNGAPKFDPANMMSPSAMRNEIIGGFSLAALKGQVGGGVQDKILDAIKAGNKLGEKQLAAIREGGRIGP